MISITIGELGEVSPSSRRRRSRIVMAGALADRGDLEGAVNFFQRAETAQAATEHHLRRAYALADLYDRAGNITPERHLGGLSTSPQTLLTLRTVSKL